MAPSRSVIVNADDFGRSTGINRGVIEAHERGIVTSASLMVRSPGAREAADYARRRPRLDIGLHLDLGEWVFRDGSWNLAYEVVSTEDRNAIAAQVQRQLDLFRQICGRNPTHLDSHQHVHRDEPARQVVLAAARQLGVPLRYCASRIRYRGDFYGQTAEGAPLPEAITTESLLRLLSSLEPGVTEVGCHPGRGDDHGSSYGEERSQEVDVLCDPRVRAFLDSEGIALVSFDAGDELVY